MENVNKKVRAQLPTRIVNLAWATIQTGKYNNNCTEENNEQFTTSVLPRSIQVNERDTTRKQFYDMGG